MRKRLLAGALVVVVLMLVPGQVQAVNTYEPEELPEIQTPEGKLLLPVIQIYGRPGIYIATQPHCNGMGLAFQMPLYEDAFVLTENGEDQLYIKLLNNGDAYQTPEGRVIGIKTKDTEFPGLRVMDDSPDGIARGRMVLIPLINYPEGTNGYTMQILQDDNGGYILPLIQTPRGHVKNGKIDNPWGIDYDMVLAVDYDVLRL